MSLATFRSRFAPKIALAAVGTAILFSGAFAALGLFGSARLLQKVHHNGKVFYTLNPVFVRNLQESGSTSIMPPVWVATEKPEGVRRIVLLGGAAAAGVPMTDYHLGRLLEARWRARFPGEAIEVINLSSEAADQRVLRAFAREAMKLDPDMVVLYADGEAGPVGEDDLRDLVSRANSRDAKVLLVLPVAWSDGETIARQKIASGSGPGVAVIDADQRLRGEGASGGDELIFPGSSRLTFSGRAAVAELMVDGIAAMWGFAPREENPEVVAAWWQKFPAAESEARRDTMFTGYDEHDMWSLALKSLPADAPQRPAMMEKVSELRRRAALKWDTTDIIVAYERAQLQNPRDPLVHFTAGRLLGLRGEGVRAEEAFARGFALQPDNAAALLNYAAMQTTRGDTDSARDALRKLENFDPQAGGLLKMQAAVAMREAELPEAAALLRKHLALEPSDAESWLTLSEIQLQLGDFSASETSRQKGKRTVAR